MSVPNMIHYCWFGGNPLPKTAQKCIASWKKYFPDYEIKEWNESNYDVRKIPYIAEAYDAKKYAFVSDYARFDILYQYGGVYFDTDVEVIKPFDDILKCGAFMGCEIDGDNNADDETECFVNPGLGIAVVPRLDIYKDILNYYQPQHFLMADGTLNTETIVTKTTNVLKQHGLKNVSEIQQIGEITIYPKEYFNPYNEATGKLFLTDNTHSIHWYTASWQSAKGRAINTVTRPFRRVFGEDLFIKIKAIGKR